MKRTKQTNPVLINTIRVLRKKARENNAEIWRDVAERLSRSKRRRTAVNLSQLNRYTEEGETAVVPGKVLGAGDVNHRVTVAAFSFSEAARSKIRKVKGACLTLLELAEKNPKGTDVKIIG